MIIQHEDTPLHYAAQFGYTFIASSLIDKGADINIQSKVNTI